MVIKKNKQAPEGGWGYVIGGVMAFTLILERGMILTYGIIFEELVLSIEGKATELVFFLSAFVLCYCLTGLFVNSLLMRFSCRQVGLLAAFLMTTGSFLTSFANSFIFILVSFSLIQGIALGLILPTIFTSFYQYFVKKKARIYFASKPLVALGAMGFPVLINYLLEEYGYRGMLLLLSGVYAQLFVVVALIQPVEWHMKDNKEEIRLKTITHVGVEETQYPLLHKSEHTEKNSEQVEEKPSEVNSGNEVKHKNLEETGKIRSILSSVTNFFDLHLLKDLSYVNLVFGVSFVEFSEISFGGLIPGYLLSIGWSMKDVALCLSTSGIGDFVSRIVLAALGFCFILKGKYIFLLASIFGFIFRIAFHFVDQYIPVTIVVTGITFCKTATISSASLIFADHVPTERFSAAFGLYMFTLGIIMLVLGPVIGAIKDYTGSYDITLYILLSCYLICIIPWISETIWKKRKDKSGSAQQLPGN